MGELYNYYTSTDTANKILTGGVIWATNIKYMNDSEEFLNGLNEIEKYDGDKVDKAKLINCVRYLRKLSNVKQYTISLCGRSDALSQWSMYAKESGVCLEMDINKYEGEIGYEIEDNMDIPELPLSFTHVIYCTDSSGVMTTDELCKARLKIKELIDSICDNEQGTNVMQDAVTKCAALIKRQEFFQEDEYRAIFNINSADTKCIGFRMDKGVLKSYVKVRCKVNGEIGWPIKSIMIGPGFNQDVVFNSWILFLDNAYLKIPKIDKDEYLIRIKEYFNKVLSKCSKSCCKKLNEIAEHHFNQWNNFSELINPWFSARIHIQHFNLIEALNDADNDEETKAVLNEYWSSNYFSASGIILKKSSIPYIF